MDPSSKCDSPPSFEFELVSTLNHDGNFDSNTPVGRRSLGNDSVSFPGYTLLGNAVWRLCLGFRLLPTKFPMVGFEYGYFLATLGIFRRGCDDSVDVDLLADCFHQPRNLTSGLCHLSAHHDCPKCYGLDLFEDVSSSNAVSVDSDDVLL